MSRAGGKSKQLQLSETFIKKGMELDELRTKVRNMKLEIGHLQEDVRARDEQIQKRSDQMLANIQTIKALDEKLAATKAKMESLELEEQTDADILRRAADLDDSPHGRIVAEMGSILASVDRLAEEVEQNPAYSSQTQGSSSIVKSVDPSKRFATIGVQYGSNSCNFPVVPSDTFGDLLDKAVSYWAMQRSQSVLVDSGGFVWPTALPVQTTLADSDDLAVRLLSRRSEADEEEKGASKEEAKEGFSREMRMQMSEIRRKAVEGGDDGGEDPLAGGAPDRPTLPGVNVAGDAAGAGDGSTREANIRKTKLRNPVSVRGHADLFCYLLFGVLFLHAVYMRMAISESHAVYRSVEEAVFLREFQAVGEEYSSLPSSPELLRGLVKFENMEMREQFWAWLDDPVKGGLINSGRQSTTGLTPLVCPDTHPHQFAINDTVRCCNNATTTCDAVVDGALTNASLCTLVPGAHVDTYSPVATNDSSSTSSGVLTPPDLCSTAIGRNALVRFNYLHGGVHMRQLRVKNDSCTIPTRFDKFERICRSAFDPSNDPDAVDTTTFGPGTQGFVHGVPVGGWSVDKRVYTQSYRVPAVRSLPAGLGDQGSYDADGYDIVLPPDPVSFNATLRHLKDNEWIDAQTRAIVVSFNVYNANYDIVAVTVALIEFTPSGRVIPHYRTKAMRLNQESSPRDGTRQMLEWVALGIIAWLFLGLVYDASTMGFKVYFGFGGPKHPSTVAKTWDERLRLMKHNKEAAEEQRSLASKAKGKGELEDAAKHEQKAKELEEEMEKQIERPDGAGLAQVSRASVWNILLLILVVLFGATFSARLVFMREARNAPLEWAVVPPQPYTDLHGLAAAFRASVNLDAMCVLVGIMQLFKFFNLNPYMSMVWIVIAEAWAPITNYVLLFVTLISSFGVAGHVLFGHQIRDYQYVDTAFNTLLRMTVGNLDYSSLDSVRGYAAPMFFGGFMVLGFFISSNIYLAILNASYSRVADGVRARGFYWLPQPKRDRRTALPPLIAEQIVKRENAKHAAAHDRPAAKV